MARFDLTYRANSPSISQRPHRRTPGETVYLDRDTYRSVMRSRSRRWAGRWDGRSGHADWCEAYDALRNPGPIDAARRAMGRVRSAGRRLFDVVLDRVHVPTIGDPIWRVAAA